MKRKGGSTLDQQLRVFITVVEKQSFSKAAAELYMTQPAVSQYIRNFEQYIGCRLLERSNKYVRLNKAGEIVYHHAKKICSLHDRMHHLIDDLTGNASGPLAIGASYTFGEYVLPHYIAKLKKRYPHVSPAVTIGNTAEIAKGVRQHELDIGIVEGYIDHKGQFQIDILAEDKMIIVAHKDHPFIEQNRYIANEELENEVWVLREDGSGTREGTEILFRRLGISPQNAITFGSTQAVKEAVRAGLGISLLSYWAVQKELERDELKAVYLPELPFERQFSIITYSSFQTKACEVFIDLLKSDKGILSKEFIL